MSEYTLGEEVMFRNPLERVTRVDMPDGKYQNSVTRKCWVPRDGKADWCEGVVVGKRTLSDGIRQWESYDDGLFGSSSSGGYEFTPEESFSAYLVAFDMRKNPVYVREDDIKEMQ